MNTFHEPERGSTLRIYRDIQLVVLHMTSPKDGGADGCYNMEAADARAIGKILIDHADAIDKSAREAALVAAMKRRNVVAQHYTDAAWSALDRGARTMIDRIIELETQQEENK